MSGDAQTQLHDAVLKVLRAAVKPTPVFEHVPQNDPDKRDFPYLVIGDGTVDEFDTDSELGQEHRLELHVFSRYRGKQEVRELQKKIYDVLNDPALTLSAGAALVLLFYEFSTIVQDPDGRTYHGIARYRAITTET